MHHFSQQPVLSGLNPSPKVGIPLLYFAGNDYRLNPAASLQRCSQAGMGFRLTAPLETWRGKKIGDRRTKVFGRFFNVFFCYIVTVVRLFSSSYHLLLLTTSNSINMPSRISPSGFKPLSDTVLFTPVQIGALKLDHRIIQAPLTRMRADKESDGVFTPGDLLVEYYGQRANKAGLQITEATNISRLVRMRSARSKGPILT